MSILSERKKSDGEKIRNVCGKNKRIGILEQTVDNWQKSQQIRSFVDALREEMPGFVLPATKTGSGSFIGITLGSERHRVLTVLQRLVEKFIRRPVCVSAMVVERPRRVVVPRQLK